EIKQGIDLDAGPGPFAPGELYGEWMSILYDGRTFGRTVNNLQALEQELRFHGEGTRAIIWSQGMTSHVYNAIYEGGRVVYYDAQIGRTLSYADIELRWSQHRALITSD